MQEVWAASPTSTGSTRVGGSVLTWVTMMTSILRAPGSSPVRTERPWCTSRSSGLVRRDLAREEETL